MESIQEPAFMKHYPVKLETGKCWNYHTPVHRLAQNCKSADRYIINKIFGMYNQALRRSVFTLLPVFLNDFFYSSVIEKFKSLPFILNERINTTLLFEGSNCTFQSSILQDSHGITLPAGCLSPAQRN